MKQDLHVCAIILGDIRYDSRCTKILGSFHDLGFRTSVVTAVDTPSIDTTQTYSSYPIILPKNKSTKFKFLIFYIRGFMTAIKLRPSFLIAADLYSLPLAWLISIIRHVPIVYDSRELYRSIAALHRRKFMQSFWSMVEWLFMHKVALVITVNNSLAEILRKTYPSKNVVVVRNIPNKQSVTRSNKLRELLGIPSSMKIILYQGGLQAGRGIPILLSLAEKIENIAFVFIGNGPMISTIEKSAVGKSNIFQIASVPSTELLHYTVSADIGATLIENYGTSYYFSLPNKLFEYIHAGIPVLGSNFPEITSIINEYRVGLTADPENSEEVCTALRSLLFDETKIQEYRTNCIKASTVLSWNREFQKLYSEIEPLLVNN